MPKYNYTNVAILKRILLNIILVFFISSFTKHAYSRITPEDSIQKYIYYKPIEAKKYAYKLLKNSKTVKNDTNFIRALNYIGQINSVLSYTDSANYFFDKAIQKSYSINNNRQLLISKITKASFLYQNYDFNNSIKLFNDALKLATEQKNEKAIKIINISLAQLKYEIGEYDESLKIFKEHYNLSEKSGRNAILDLFIAKTYLKTNEPDSSLHYIKKGLSYSQNMNDNELHIYFLNEYGVYLTIKKQYHKATNEFEKAILKCNEIESIQLKHLINLSKAKLYKVQGEYDKSIQTLKKILQEKELSKAVPEELSEFYELLYLNYQSLNNINQSSFYYKKHLEQENKKHSKKFNIIKDLHELDLTKINKQKDSYFKQKKFLYKVVFVLAVFLLSILALAKKKLRNNEKKFQVLLKKVESVEEVKKNTKTKDITDHQFMIKDEKITEILSNLKKLETNKYFLRHDFTLHNAAKILKTNTAYLSKIVNNELGKSFSDYLNELRISYVIMELKNNSRLRAYSVSSIAEEIGYKSPDSFTKYFKATTGLNPSIYIRKIDAIATKKAS